MSVTIRRGDPAAEAVSTDPGIVRLLAEAGDAQALKVRRAAAA